MSLRPQTGSVRLPHLKSDVMINDIVASRLHETGNGIAGIPHPREDVSIVHLGSATANGTGQEGGQIGRTRNRAISQ